jgi:hypothetical protein
VSRRESRTRQERPEQPFTAVAGAEQTAVRRKPNYDFEKRRKEQERKARKDAKRAEKERRGAEESAPEGGESAAAPGEAPTTSE